MLQFFSNTCRYISVNSNCRSFRLGCGMNSVGTWSLCSLVCLPAMFRPNTCMYSVWIVWVVQCARACVMWTCLVNVSAEPSIMKLYSAKDENELADMSPQSWLHFLDRSAISMGRRSTIKSRRPDRSPIDSLRVVPFHLFSLSSLLLEVCPLKSS